MYLEPSSEEFQVGSMLGRGVERVQDLETGHTDLPYFIKQHPAHILQVVVKQELHTANKAEQSPIIIAKQATLIVKIKLYICYIIYVL